MSLYKISLWNLCTSSLQELSWEEDLCKRPLGKISYAMSLCKISIRGVLARSLYKTFKRSLGKTLEEISEQALYKIYIYYIYTYTVYMYLRIVYTTNLHKHSIDMYIGNKIYTQTCIHICSHIFTCTCLYIHWEDAWERQIWWFQGYHKQENLWSLKASLDAPASRKRQAQSSACSP